MTPIAKCPYCLRWTSTDPIGYRWAFTRHIVAGYPCEGTGHFVRPGDWYSLAGDP